MKMTKEEIQGFIFLYPDIKKAIKPSAITDLANILQPEETLEKAILGKPNTAIIQTNTRIIIISNGFLGAKIESEYFNSIKQASYKKGIFSGSIQIKASKNYTFQTDKQKGQGFIEGLNAKLANASFNHRSAINKKPMSLGTTVILFIVGLVALGVILPKISPTAAPVDNKKQNDATEFTPSKTENKIAKQEVLKPKSVSLEQYGNNLNAMFSNLKLPYKFKAKVKKGDWFVSVTLSSYQDIIIYFDEKTKSIENVIFILSGNSPNGKGVENSFIAGAVIRAMTDANAQEGVKTFQKLRALLSESNEKMVSLSQNNLTYALAVGEFTYDKKTKEIIPGGKAGVILMVARE